MKKLKFFAALNLTITIAHASVVDRELSCRLDSYDFQDIIEVAQLCDVAYGSEASEYTSLLENNDWEIRDVRNNDDYQYGIVAYNGP